MKPVGLVKVRQKTLLGQEKASQVNSQENSDITVARSNKRETLEVARGPVSSKEQDYVQDSHTKITLSNTILEVAL